MNKCGGAEPSLRLNPGQLIFYLNARTIVDPMGERGGLICAFLSYLISISRWRLVVDWTLLGVSDFSHNDCVISNGRDFITSPASSLPRCFLIPDSDSSFIRSSMIRILDYKWSTRSSYNSFIVWSVSISHDLRSSLHFRLFFLALSRRSI